MIRILIADDHPLVLGGLLQLFSLEADMTVVGQAGTGAQVIESLGVVACDLVLLDISMPGVCGVELISQIRTRAPNLPILVFSMHNEVWVLHQSLQAGASGYIGKDGDPELLPVAVRKVVAGGRYVDPCLAERSAFARKCEQFERPHERLPKRQLEILSMIVNGKRVNQIADELKISHKTVSAHKARLMQAMNFQGEADLLRYGITHALCKRRE